VVELGRGESEGFSLSGWGFWAGCLDILIGRQDVELQRKKTERMWIVEHYVNIA
jgi:hypothetical protein